MVNREQSDRDLDVIKSSAKAIFLQSAALAGFGVSANSTERFSELIDKWQSKVPKDRRPEAVASILKIIAATLEEAQKSGVTSLSESDVDAGRESVCPIYPND
ncbi:hypothetical protein ACN9ML_29280 [Dyadobacter endophyticus]|uniref:hypothetical protein n=1 Tax=Dyadobacter endophyticus TaxID=1749036 RepID=UPI003CEB87FC